MRPTLNDIHAAAQVIRSIADNTPLIPSPYLSARTGQDFLLKLENMQPIGAFKLRGALNAVANLPDDAKGVTCCSTGNHGRGVSYAAQARGIKAVICMSNMVPQVKVDGIRTLGAEVRIAGQTQDEVQEEVNRLVAEEGLVEISPFDDAHVIAGQGTIGLELMEKQPDLEAILLPLSGGGLASGIALAAKAIKPNMRIIGVTMDFGAAMYESLRAGHLVDVAERPSLADSLGGGIGPQNLHTFEMCRDLLDDTVLVSEEEIYHAMQALYYEDRVVAEGSCATSIAAVLSEKVPIEGPTAAVITGRNVDMGMFTQIVTGQDVTLGNLTIKGSAYKAA